MVAVELQLRNHFTIANATSGESLKDLAFQEIVCNEDVLFFWDMLSVNWEHNEASELFKMVIQHYITIRGFSFANAFTEKYKQATKKSTQKSKGLRKKLDNSKCDND